MAWFLGLHAALQDLYGTEDGALADKDGDAPLVPQEDFVKAAKKIFRKKGYRPEMLAEKEPLKLVTDTYEAYQQAVRLGIADNEIPEAMAKKLDHDAFLFSGFKVHHELSEVGLSLRDGDGKLKSYEQFERDVLKIHRTYNRNYLRSEYDFAAKWKDFEAKKDRYHLQYRTAADDRVREEHAALHGITLPPDDPFWKQYFPPNGWRCFPAGTKILSFAGSWRNIEDIRVGDMVVGGSGQYQLVTAVHVRPFAGELVGIRSERSWTSCTPNHRVFTSMGWKEAGNLSVGDMLVQVGKIGFFHKAVNAIHNLYALCRYGCMSLAGKREASRALAVDGQRRAGKVEVDDVPSYPFPELEPNPLASKKLKENRFVAAGGKPQCRHPFRMPRTALQGMFQRFLPDFLPEKGRIGLELVRHAAHHLAVALVHALPHMKAGKGQLVVDLRKQLPGRLSSFFRVNPLGLDRFAPMADGKAGKGNQTGNHPVVCLPAGAQVPVTPLLADIPQFHGIPEIHSFDGFHSFCHFLKRTFFHCRYVLVTGKDRVKADTVVYNLSVDNDESYVVPCGIVHNCRCTAVQVNKGKYPLSDSKEAVRKGEKATTQLDRFGNNKAAIFRFNPGIDERLFPPKHPYLPKGCGDCNRGIRNLAYNPDNPMCQACTVIATCADKELVRITSKEWIADAIRKASDGKPCKRAITVAPVPEKMLDFCEKNKIDLAPGGLQVTDDGIMHALRPNKKARGAAISTEQMENMAEILEKADIYYDSADDKRNFVFVAEDKGKILKYVFNPNYTARADGKKEKRNLFVTAGIIQVYNINWTKIE